MKGMQDYYLTGTYTCRCGKVILTATVLLNAAIRSMGMPDPAYDIHIAASDVQTKYFDGEERLRAKFGKLYCPKCGEFIDIDV